MTVAQQISGPVNLQASQSFEKSVNIHILNRLEFDLCPFWLEFTDPGTLSFKQLSEMRSFQDVLSNVSKHGCQDDCQMIFSDNQEFHAKTILLFRNYSGTTLMEKAKWFGQISLHLKNLSPDSLGFHWNVKKLAHLYDDMLPTEIFRQLISSTNINNYYLISDSPGKVKLINFAQKIKNNLLEENINLTIFH